MKSLSLLMVNSVNLYNIHVIFSMKLEYILFGKEDF